MTEDLNILGTIARPINDRGNWLEAVQAWLDWEPPKNLMTSCLLHGTNKWINWNIAYEHEDVDHWKLPEELFDDMSGDCEDYALAKLGILSTTIDADDMAIVVGKMQGQHHAVLYLPRRQEILDNKVEWAIPVSAMDGLFLPIISVTKDQAFLHGVPQVPVADTLK